MLRPYAFRAWLVAATMAFGCTPAPATAPQPPAARDAPVAPTWLETPLPKYNDHFTCRPAITPRSLNWDAPEHPSCASRKWGCGRLHDGKAEACPELFDLSFLGSAVVGYKWVLRRSNAGWFGLHREGGIIGPVAPNTPGWFGVDDHDQLIRVHADNLVRASRLPSVDPKSWTTRGRVPPGATLWDISSTLLAAAQADTVFVSTNGGGTFQSSQPQPGATVVALAARQDGVLAVQVELAGEQTTWLTRDAGQRYERSRFQPQVLRRLGGLVYGWAHGCGDAVLSSDGQHWASVERPDESAFAYEELFEHSRSGAATQFEPNGDRHKPRMLPPPAPDDEVTSCPEAGRGWGRSHRARPPRIRMGGNWPDCHHTGCLERRLDTTDEQHFTASQWSFFHDALCGRGNKCFSSSQRFRRRPSLLRVDRERRSAHAVALPPTCEPQRLDQGRGLVALTCDSDRDTHSKIYVADQQGHFHHEATVESMHNDDVVFEVARDGSAAFFGSVPFQPLVWIRSAAAAGEGRWHRWQAPDLTLAFRGLEQGRIAAIGYAKPDDLIVTLSPQSGEHSPEVVGRLKGAASSDATVLGLCRRDASFFLITAPPGEIEPATVHKARNGYFTRVGTLPEVRFPLCAALRF